MEMSNFNISKYYSRLKILSFQIIFGIVIVIFINKPISANVDVYFQPNYYSIQFLEKDQIQDYRNRSSYQVYRIGTEVEIEREYADIFLDCSYTLPFSATNTNKGELFLGKNAFISVPFRDFELNIGRKAFLNRHPIQNHSGLDGTEGISISVQYWENVFWEVTLWDIYRGYPLWEYQQTTVYKAEEKKEELLGERSRHGTSFIYVSDFWEFDTDFYYLNLGNWGRSSRDDLVLRQQEGGDGDFYHRTRVGVTGKWEGFRIHFQSHFARGLDKTFSDPKRPERSLPIQGEAIRVEMGYSNDFLFSFLSAFVPNTAQTGESNQALNIGYVGMGNHLAMGTYLTRVLDNYPSAWIGAHGLENIIDVRGSRKSSMLASWKSGLIIYNWKLGILIETLIPRLIQAHDKGEISFRKVDYSKEAFSEVTGILEYNQRSFSSATSLGIEVGYLWSSYTLNTSGTSIRLYGRFQF
jgi:hypothetical protein